MPNVEATSWYFVSREWEKQKRGPSQDKGFEDSFKDYLSRKIRFERYSYRKDMGLGLSYATLSSTPHELDFICSKDNDLYVFELKSYTNTRLSKEVVFTFLGKVFDFYMKNLEELSCQRITMYLVTTQRDIDDKLRKLCLTYGIKLIESSLMTVGSLDYYAREIYTKIPDENTSLKDKAAGLVHRINGMRDLCDYSFSDLFGYKNGDVILNQELLSKVNPTKTVDELKRLNNIFGEVLNRWRRLKN